jgi:phage repressor protein C with HTH and peptisase S24 domain
VLVPDPIDYLRRSERMLNVRSPFAFNVLGASMSPAIEHGDQVIINPSIVARPGHDCVFIHEGPDGMLALVKRLIRPGSDHYRVRQFNEPKDFDLSRRKWTRVHPIAEIRKAGVG